MSSARRLELVPSVQTNGAVPSGDHADDLGAVADVVAAGRQLLALARSATPTAVPTPAIRASGAVRPSKDGSNRSR